MQENTAKSFCKRKLRYGSPHLTHLELMLFMIPVAGQKTLTKVEGRPEYYPLSTPV